MKVTSQVIVSLASLATVFILGQAFQTAFWQAGYHAKHLLYGKPLPTGTQFLIDHHELVVYMALLPWLWLVGAPLLTLRAASAYWDATAFGLRYLAFLACEFLLFTMLLLLLSLPFMAYYGVLQSDQRSTIESIASYFFWFGLVTTVIAALCRMFQLQRLSHK